MSNEKPLTIENLHKVMESLIPEFNNQDIDDFVAKGNKIEDIIFVTCIETMKDVPKMRTKHGIMRVKYNRYLPNHANFLMKEPKTLFDYPFGL